MPPICLRSPTINTTYVRMILDAPAPKDGSFGILLMSVLKLQKVLHLTTARDPPRAIIIILGDFL